MNYLKKTNVRVKFVISGNEFNPQTISDKLKMTPSKMWEKGDIIENRSTNRRYSAWILGGEFIETLDAGKEIENMVNLIEEKTNVMKNLKKKLNVDYTFSIAIEIWNEQTPSITLSNEIISFANAVGADLDFDMYVYNS